MNENNYKNFKKNLVANYGFLLRFGKLYYILFLLASIIFISFNVDIIKYEFYINIFIAITVIFITYLTFEIKCIFIYNNLKKDNKTIISLWKYIKFRHSEENFKYLYKVEEAIISFYICILFFFIMHKLLPLFTNTIFYNYFNFFSYCYKSMLFTTNYLLISIVFLIFISNEIFSLIKYKNYKKEGEKTSVVE